MESGRLRHAVKIIDSATSLNEEREPVQEPIVFAERWAEVRPVSGREYRSDTASHAEATHEVTLRWLAGVTPKMKLEWNSRSFEIVQVLNLNERNTELKLICKELV